MPKRATDGSAGFDLFALEDGFIFPGERRLVPIGIAMEIPLGYFGCISSRSGLATKYGIKVGARTIDSDYRGEINVLLYNNQEPGERAGFGWSAGDRIAQLVILPCIMCDMEEGELSETGRGSAGFGSTGR